MAKDHDPQDSKLAHLIEGVQTILAQTERSNEARHVELMCLLRGDDVLGRLNALRSRLARVARALATLDAQT